MYGLTKLVVGHYGAMLHDLIERGRVEGGAPHLGGELRRELRL